MSRAAAQFEANSNEYRCCCECCHVKTAAILIGLSELCLILFFLVNSIVLIVNTGGIDQYLSEGGTGNPAIMGPFATCLAFLFLGILAVILLFTGLLRKSACLLIPHIVVQIIAIIFFFGLITCASLALATELTVFYRILNVVAFEAHPDQTTVSLSFNERVPVYIGLTIYILGFLLEVWFTYIIYRCYRYFSERDAYVHYVRQYSVPLNSVPNRYGSSVPQYTPR